MSNSTNSSNTQPKTQPNERDEITETNNEITPLLSKVGDSIVEIRETVFGAADYAQDVIQDFWEDFRAFVHTGPLLQLAVGIIVGGGVNSILDSLVQDIIIPPLSVLGQSKVALINYYWIISYGVAGGPYATLVDAKADGAVTENYGMFISKLIDFAITAFALFWIIKAFQSLKRYTSLPSKVEGTSPKEIKCRWCCSMINIEAHKCPFVINFN